MQIPRKIYGEYEVRDSIPAYTTDHVYYDYEKDGILPREEFRDNELRKAMGVFCGCVIYLLTLYLFWTDCEKNFKRSGYPFGGCSLFFSVMTLYIPLPNSTWRPE